MKRAGRILLWVFVGVVLLAGILFLAARTPRFQTWLAQRVTAYLSKELKTRVYVDKVEIKFISSVALKGFYIEDLRHDTLLYADELTVGINRLNSGEHVLSIGAIKLSRADFFLTHYRGDKHDNLKFLTDYFSSSDTIAPDTTQAKWKVTFAKLELEDVRFRHEVQDDSIFPVGVDFSHLDVKNINGEFSNIHFVNDSIFTVIEGLRFKDHSGFELTEFSGDTKVSSEGLRIKGLVIKSPYTDIHTDLVFKYDSFADFDDFLNKVRWQSEFRHSTVSFKDIAYFATDLWGMNSTVIINGNCKGTVSDFKCRNVEFRFGSQTYFKGNIALTGLPNIEETYFAVQGDEIVSTKKDIETIPVKSANKAGASSDTAWGHVVIPPNLTALGKVTFKGRFTGFYNDFVAYGNATTAIGYLTTDINLKYNQKQKKEFYSGHLSVNKFNVGKLWEVPEVGLLSFNADVNGSGLRLDNAEAKMKGVVSLLQFKNYSYQNININGTLSKKLFEGSLGIQEPNVDLAFKGQVNFQQELPQFNFTADINHLHLDTLNLVRLPGEAEINSKIFIDVTGNKPDNLSGEVSIKEFNYKSGQSLYHINNISLTSSIYSEEGTIGYRLIHLTSDFLDADFKGQFDFKNLNNAFTQILPEYFPTWMPDCKRVNTTQNFTFNINLKNVSLITEKFLPAWQFDPNTLVKGRFNSVQNSFEATVISPLARFNNLTLINEDLKIVTTKEAIIINSEAEKLLFADSSFWALPKLFASGAKNKIDFTVQVADSSIYENRGAVKGSLAFLSPTKMQVNLLEASIHLENEPWTIDKNNVVTIDTSTIVFTHFNFSKVSKADSTALDANLVEAVGLEGVISKLPDDKVALSFSNFRLDHLNTLFPKGKTTLGGAVTGQAELKNVYAKANVVSDMKVLNLAFNGDTLGNAVINSTYDNENKVVQLSVNVLKKDVKTISITGDYYTSRKENNIDFKIELRNFYLNPYERYVNDIVSDLRGKISADLHMKGTFSKPVFDGTVDFTKAGCKVIYLNTNYSFNDRVYVKENYFELKNFVLRDDKGSSGKVNGTVEHDYFKNFYLDLRLDATKFQVLNTSYVNNEVYYGTAYGSGYATFIGPPNNINMDIQMKSERGTEIYLPLSSTSDVSRGEYITFVNKSDSTKKGFYKTKVVTTGINLNLRMVMTTDAYIELIFDEKIGDKIRGTGTGNLDLTLNPAGEFRMYGEYIIEHGDYLFTLQNIINKHFEVESGGTISWKGDPLDADINLVATYRSSTSTLYKLMRDSTLRRRLNYDVVLHLSNKLMNPTINYSINVLGLDATTESQVRSKLNSEMEVSKQVFGLLVLNQFIPPSNGDNAEIIDAGGSASASAGELLSGQLSNWMSQLSKSVTLGFNYKAKDTYSREEFDLMFSKNLLNDRLLVEGNVGYASSQEQGNVIGDFNLEYMMTENGRLKLKAFNKSNINSQINYTAPYTQGVGFLYHKEANKVDELFFGKKKENKETKPEPQPPLKSE